VYEDRAKGAPPAERVQILHEVAEVCATRLNDVDGAIAAYRRAYVLHPEVATALPALIQAVERHDRWPTLVEAYLSRARAAQPEEAVELLRRAAHVYLDKTRDVDAAMAILRRAAERYPEVPESLAALREAVRRNGRWSDLIAYYEARVGETEGGARVKLLHEIARIQDTELDKVDDALSTLRRAYDLDPGEPEALAVLDATLIQKKRWEDLLELLEERAKVALPADRVDLLHRAAHICMDELGDADRQIGMLKRALQLAPGEARALDAYREALTAAKRWQELVDLHRALANRAGDDQAKRAEHLLECVRLLRHELKDYATAFRIRVNLFDVDKPDAEALGEIEQIAAEGGEWEGLGNLYQSLAEKADEGSELRFATLTKLAVLLEEKLESPDPAYARYLKAFGARPGDAATLANLRRLAEKTGRWEPLLGVHRTLVQMTGDPDEKVEVLKRNAVIQEHKLHDEDGAFETLIEAFGYDPENEEVRQEVWRLAATDADREKAARGDAAPEVREDGSVLPPRRWGRLIQVYEAKIQDSEEIADRVRYLRRIGRVFALPLGDLESSFKVLALAAKLSPRDSAPLDDIEDYGRKAAGWEKVLDTFRHSIDDIDDHAASVILYNRMARIAEEEIQDSTRAEELSRRTLAMQPDDAEALGRLKRILRRGARSSDLATTLEREADEAKGDERRRVLLELAALWEGELTNPREAALIYEKILAENPEDREVLGKLIKLYEETHDTRKLADAYQRMAAKEPDKRAADELRKKVGHLYMDTLQEPKLALEIFRKVFEGSAAEGRVDTEALDALDSLYERLHRWDEVLVLCKVRAQVVQGEERVAVMVRQARILEEFKKQPEAAAEILRAVLQTSPANPDARAAMMRNLRGAGDWDGLIAFCEGILNAAEEPGAAARSAAATAALHAEIGDAHFRLGHHDSAAESFERALAIDALFRPALSGLRAIREWREEWAEAVSIAEREAQLADGADKVDLYRHAAEIRRDKLADLDGARTLLRAALDSQPDSAEVARALTLFAAGAEDWRRVLKALQARLGVADHKAEKVALLIEIGRTQARGFGNRADALASFEKALDLKPGAPGALVAMAELFELTGELEDEGVARKLEGELSEAMLASELAKDSVETGRLFLYYAKVLLAQGKIDHAITALRRARDKYPRLLHVALGLGEALYRAVRFPEAEPHFRFVAEHVTVHDYPDEGADALYKLGLIARARGDLDKARGYLERAAENKARAGEALLSAAEVAREAHQSDREIGYLDRLLAALDSPTDRAVVRARLGQIYAEELRDPERALGAYRAALADQVAATEAAEGSITWEVAGRMLELCLERDALSEARDVAARIAAVPDWGAEAATVHLKLGEAFERLGDVEEARFHVWKAAEIDPASEDTFQARVRFHHRREEWKALVELLQQRLAGLEAATPPEARARLLVELARVLVRGLDDPGRAVPLLDEAAQLLPASREITRVQIELLSEGWKKPDELIELHRKVIADEPWNVESVRAIIPLLRRLDATKRSYWPAAILTYFGLATEEEKQVAEYHRPSDVRRGGSVMDAECYQVLSHRDTRLLEKVFRLVWEGAADLFLETLEGAGLKNEDRVSPLAEIPAAKAFKYVSRLMGTPVLGLFQKPAGGAAPSISVVLTKPPALVARGVEAHTERALMFRFGRALQACRSEFVAFIAPEDEAEARVLYDAVMGAFHPGVKPKDIHEAARDLAKQLRRKLGIRTREKIADLMKEYVARHGAPDFARWNRAVWAGINRAGILMAGDLELALDVMLGAEPGRRPQGAEALHHTCETHPEVADLLAFVLTGDFFWLRTKLGFQTGWTGKTSVEAIQAEQAEAARRESAARRAAEAAAGSGATRVAATDSGETTTGEDSGPREAPPAASPSGAVPVAAPLGALPAEAPSGAAVADAQAPAAADVVEAAPGAAPAEAESGGQWSEPAAEPPAEAVPADGAPAEEAPGPPDASGAPPAAEESSPFAPPPETESSPFESAPEGGGGGPSGANGGTDGIAAGGDANPFAAPDGESGTTGEPDSGAGGGGAAPGPDDAFAPTTSGSVDVELPYVGEDGEASKPSDGGSGAKS
jgi:tetratricopeptide (TPR) repeat protein